MGLGGISLWQLLIILVIVVLLFGTKKLSTLGSDLGGAVKGFRKAMGDAEEGDDKKLKEPDAEFAETSEQRETEQNKAS